MLLMTEMGLMFKAIKESLHIITLIVISFILILVCPHHSDTHCQRSVQDKLFFLQEHLAEEQSLLH